MAVRLAFADGVRTCKRVQEGEQRQLLAELVPGAPEDLVRTSRRTVVHAGGLAQSMTGGRERAADEGGLADARLALDEHGVATALGELFQ